MADSGNGNLNTTLSNSFNADTSDNSINTDDNNVTAEQWESMATRLVYELQAAHGLTEYMTNVNDLRAILIQKNSP